MRIDNSAPSTHTSPFSRVLKGSSAGSDALFQEFYWAHLLNKTVQHCFVTGPPSCHKSASQTSRSTDCQYGMLRHHRSRNWSLPITLPTTHWTLTFYTASWGYGNARLGHKNQTPAQSDVGTEKVTSLALARGPHSGLHHLKYPASRLGMAQCCCSVVLCEPLQLSEVKALFVTEWSFTVYESHHQNGTGLGRFLEETGPTAVCWKTSAVGGNVRESDSLALKSSVSVNQRINRQDVELFSLKISAMTNFCPYWDS